MTPAIVSAPGKVFLSGEYAVTEGAPAVVAAVDRRVEARFHGVGDRHPDGPEASAAFEIAQDMFGPVAHRPALNRSPLFSGGTKLGLGSSAAGAVAMAAAVAARHQHDLGDPEVRRRVLQCALRGHERVAPHGSGADVAASTFGDVIEFRRSRDERVCVERLRAPESLVLSLIWTGSAVRTSDLLERVAWLRTARPAKHRQAMSRLHTGANELAESFGKRSTGAIVEGAHHYGRAMRALGHAADAPIVDDRLERITRLAMRHGGAAKPSGAGGGDIAVAFFDDPDAAHHFETACTEAGFHPIDVRWAAPGVRLH